VPRILMVASEAAPFAKTGGLADVIGSLPAALARLGDEVAVVIPRYRTVPIEDASVVLELPVYLGGRTFPVAIHQTLHHNVRYFFADCPPLYDRPGIYGEAGGDYPDNHLRFALLNQAAIAVARRLFRPQVFHAHDWQAGLLPVYLRENLALDPTFSGVRCVFTIHNLGYRGDFPASTVSEVGLKRALFHPEGLEFFGQLSFLKAGIVWADAVNTVSPTYAREIQTPEFGFGMDGLLRADSAKLSGILNGVDYDEWSPDTDRHLPAQYSSGDLAGKRVCKAALLEEMGLPPDLDRPLLGVVSRFAEQKGMDLLAGAAVSGDIAPDFAADSPLENAALVVLGSGDPVLERTFRELAAAHPERIAFRVGYNEGLAHRIEAGSDMFLMPSRYEPCGLNQIYSLRYGTVPVVRSTGGLQDTVDSGTGFKFTGRSAADLARAITAALEAFKDRPSWIARMRRGMAKDFSWDASAKEYQKLYRAGT
jgi:starch synthase